MPYRTMTALVSPFRGDELDREGFDRLLDRQIAGGVQGLVPCGCTGEAAVLSTAEREYLIGRSVEKAQGRVEVIAGTGSNATPGTIELTRMAERIGCDAAMLITPYYNKPTQEGLYRHYMEVAESTEIPLIIYNVPGRTGVTIQPETVARLHESGRFPAIKEASGSLEQASRIRSLCGITVLSGEDSLTLPLLAVGAEGVISVVSNLVPDKVSRMVTAFGQGRTEEARGLHDELFPLFRGAFLETNPGPIKWLLARAGVCSGHLRLPLVPVSEDTAGRLEELAGAFL
jgi:4-hydroxy-tetrahydrodipicolinate synthase